MPRHIELAYLGSEVPDPAALTPFFGDVIGVVSGEPGADGAVTWRNDDPRGMVRVESWIEGIGTIRNRCV